MRPRLLLSGCALALACTDPRARPMAPEISLSFADSTVVKSPGDLNGSLHASDGDGLLQVRIAIASGDSALRLDSAIELRDLFSVSRSLRFRIPAGVPIGTAVRVIGRAEDFSGFLAADTAVFVVEDTVNLRL